MQNKLLFLFIILFSKLSISQQFQLSKIVEISVLTIGPGNSLSDAFGHSAFRVKDDINGIDEVYGYGGYDFNAPNFYLKFIQGKLNYLINKTDFISFYRYYAYTDRSIKEQILNFSISEKQKLYDYLVENYKPENRAYLYDFFYNNCATKIKEITKIASKSSVVFKPSKDFKDASYRTLIQNNLNKNSWGSLGIDIALGSVIDRLAPTENHMFLPENIYMFFKNATIGKNKKPLIKKTHYLYNKKTPTKSSFFLTSPYFVLSVMALIILYITFKDYKKKKQTQWLDILLFTVTGLIGFLILFLWFATDHTTTHQNYNLLWAFALNTFCIGQLFKTKWSLWFVKYLKFLVVLLSLLTLHWIAGVQVFSLSLIPILLAILIRYVFLISYHKK